MNCEHGRGVGDCLVCEVGDWLHCWRDGGGWPDRDETKDLLARIEAMYVERDLLRDQLAHRRADAMEHVGQCTNSGEFKAVPPNGRASILMCLAHLESWLKRFPDHTTVKPRPFPPDAKFVCAATWALAPSDKTE